LELYIYPDEAEKPTENITVTPLETIMKPPKNMTACNQNSIVDKIPFGLSFYKR
jgi:hypothetical protein